MTENKRFEYIEATDWIDEHVIDYSTEPHFEYYFLKGATDKLNVLNDENQKLKKENEQLKKENWILTHFFEQVYYDYMICCGADDDKELMEMSNAFQSKDLREILRYCIGETDKEKLKYYSKLYKVDLE